MFYCISTFYLYYCNYLNIGATHAISVGTDFLTEELKIPEDYWMTLQIGSKEHFHGITSVPAFLNQRQYCHKCDKGSNQNAPCILVLVELNCVEKSLAIQVQPIGNRTHS